MRSSSILFAFVFWLTLAGLALAAEVVLDLQPSVENDSIFPSGRFSARFIGDGFVITDKERLGEPAHVLSMPPVYRAARTADGQTLATVEHVAGGSDFAAFHFVADEGKWFRMNVVPTGVYRSYRVEKWDVRKNDISLTYEVQTGNQQGTSRSMLVPLTIDQSVFTRFFGSLKARGQGEVWTGVVELSPSGMFRLVPCVAPVQGRGILAIDTDGSGSAHDEPSPPHQNWTSSMKDGAGRFVWRRHPLPSGYEELNADQDQYGVAPKNCAKVNGGPLEPGGKMELVPANQKRERIQIGDFGPDNKYGEVAYSEIGPLTRSSKPRADHIRWMATARPIFL